MDGKDKKALCLEVHDLIASKLVRYEEKDRDFAEAAVKFGMADPNRIKARIAGIVDERFTEEKRKIADSWSDRKIETFVRPQEDMIGPPYGTEATGPMYRVKYPNDPTDMDGMECGQTTQDGILCRRRGVCPIHGK
jgi:hypothetical protein